MEINDFISYFDFINDFDFKSFGLILILKFKFLLKTKVKALYMKKYFLSSMAKVFSKTSPQQNSRKILRRVF